MTRLTDVRFKVYGFDTGAGMPPPTSYRDHPELYQKGNFPMRRDILERSLPPNAQLVIGEVRATVGPFLQQVSAAAPIGFVSINVDYYSSTREALSVFDGRAEQYLPRTMVYLDDLEHPSHNSWCGERLAIREFSDEHDLRKIEQHAFLRSYRIFRNARWIGHVYASCSRPREPDDTRARTSGHRIDEPVSRLSTPL